MEKYNTGHPKREEKVVRRKRRLWHFLRCPRTRHIRHSVKHVRAEYYMTVDELMSVYHLSMEQAISAVITVGKRMFGLEWKRFEEGEEITINTVPDKKMNRKMGKAL